MFLKIAVFESLKQNSFGQLRAKIKQSSVRSTQFNGSVTGGLPRAVVQEFFMPRRGLAAVQPCSHAIAVSVARTPTPSAAGVYWTAFIGLFFDYYDLYLFVYLEKVLAADFGFTPYASDLLQFCGLAAVGCGSLLFGYWADRVGREKILGAVFLLYVLALGGLSIAWSFWSVLVFRVAASLALGAEWGVSHALMSERAGRYRRYQFSAWLQFAILGGLLAALATRFGLPFAGWRGLFAASIIPVAVLSFFRWRWLTGAHQGNVVLETTPMAAGAGPQSEAAADAARTGIDGFLFVRCLALASLTIASGYINLFFVKELPQSVAYTILFWVNAVPGMLLGALIVRRMGVRRALVIYAASLIALSLLAWTQWLPGGKLSFALILPVLNGIPFGLMGAYFNEVFARHRTMLSGGAYNLGRIVAGFAPLLITALGLHEGENYFLFSAGLGVGVLAIGWSLHDRPFALGHGR